MSLLAIELLLDTSVEEEGDVGVLFGLCLVSHHLLEHEVTYRQCDTADTLLTKPFGKDVGHGSRRESNGEWKFAIVSSHGGDV